MKGVLNLVSVGPGFSDLIVPRAIAALQDSDVIVAYELYLRWIQPWLAAKEIHTPPLTQERERAQLAIEKARQGARVALISSGDIGIYAMAALAFDEMREDDSYEVNVVPGITSANACASLLGSPLSHDFATLSLSDLLCPWSWIEQRAAHIAQADLACVLYNVQSAGRQEGVYRILNIMLASKSPQTWCGVVRNAYRPEQQVNTYRLAELPALKFDMLTTIVIGNRFTERRRGYIFTPRGYNDWSAVAQETVATSAVRAADGTGESALPQGALWVFSGTSDGNALANRLAGCGNAVVVSAATEYGATLVQEDCPGVTVWAGRAGVEARRRALVASGARALIDATHPYAGAISQQLIALSRELDIEYLRYERPSTLLAGVPAQDAESAIARDGASVIELCASPEHAAQRAIAQGQRIFLATGSKDLAAFLQAPGAADKKWFVRITAEPDFIQRAIDLGVPRSQICAMQGPFSPAFNTALWQDWQIDCVVTKDSGEAGGFDAKAAAAAALGIPLLVIERPQVAYPAVVASFDAVLEHLNRRAVS
jgi:precorrin-6x reductase